MVLPAGTRPGRDNSILNKPVPKATSGIQFFFVALNSKELSGDGGDPILLAQQDIPLFGSFVRGTHKTPFRQLCIQCGLKRRMMHCSFERVIMITWDCNYLVAIFTPCAEVLLAFSGFIDDEDCTCNFIGKMSFNLDLGRGVKRVIRKGHILGCLMLLFFKMACKV